MTTQMSTTKRKPAAARKAGPARKHPARFERAWCSASLTHEATTLSEMIAAVSLDGPVQDGEVRLVAGGEWNEPLAAAEEPQGVAPVGAPQPDQKPCDARRC